MAVITLTTDLGLKDYYVGSIKGAILKDIPSAHIRAGRKDATGKTDRPALFLTALIAELSL